MSCAWCRSPIPRATRSDARFCSRKCRQAAWRLRCYVGPESEASAAPGGDTSPLQQRRLAYADPPYPGCAKRDYGHHPDYAGEVDHVSLIDRLATYDGWALSTSARALRDLLPLCPADAHLCAWVKPKSANQAKHTRGFHNVFEAVIVKPARLVSPGVPDALTIDAARLGGSDLIGRKPLQFCAWLFRALGASPCDAFDDLFPGSGIVAAAWREFAGSPVAAIRATDKQLDLVELCAPRGTEPDFDPAKRAIGATIDPSYAPEASP